MTIRIRPPQSGENEASHFVDKAATEAPKPSKPLGLFIGNLSWNVNDPWLRNEFEPFGELSSVRVVTDYTTGHSKGYGYVYFVNAEDTARALAAKQGAEVDGRPLRMDFAAVPRWDNPQQGDKSKTRKAIDEYISSITDDLWELNIKIHDNPEPAFEEHQAHDNITAFLESHKHQVDRHAYGLDTAFESVSSSGTGGRKVNFNAEYDALPGIGHACGHNLISTASITAFMALSHVLNKFQIRGQVQLLGTPAEEGGGGKIKLLDAGAYHGVAASLMSHPLAQWFYDQQPNTAPNSINGVAGQSTLASGDITTTFTGRSAHAAANPWDGINALDALVASYNNISLLRQQLHPDERIHGAIQSAPKITNAIPEHTSIKYTVRSAKISRLDALKPRVEKCIEAAAVATGCSSTSTSDPSYADVNVNLCLAAEFAAQAGHWGLKLRTSVDEPVPGSTDQGNVTYAVPGLHAVVAIEAENGGFPHNRPFADAARKRAAFDRYLAVGKGLAMTGLRVLVDDDFYAKVKGEFNTAE